MAMFDGFRDWYRQQSWQLQNETIIAVGLFMFSMTMLVAYQGVVISISDGNIDTSLTCYSLIAYPIFCILRLFSINRFGTRRYFGVITSIIDCLLLSVILFMYSVQYGSIAATLKSPSFVFYFVLIAIHGMRFIPKLTLINGACCIGLWTSIVFVLKTQSDGFTDSYAEFANSGAVMLGTELEKILALFVFTFIVAFGAKRVSRLHRQEKEGQRRLFEQESEAQKLLHLQAQKAQEKYAEITLQEEKRISKLKTEFINTMSHEIRTPMNGVIGMLQALRLTNTDEQQSKLIDVMETSGDRLVNLLSDILEYAKFVDDKISLNETAFDLKHVVKTSRDKFVKDCEDKSLELKLHYDPQTPDLLVGDSGLISRVIDNLLDNAIKFSNTGTVGLVVSGQSNAGEANLYFEVYDNGIGMETSKLESIFKPFHQIDGSNTRAYEGPGLGLALCQRIAQAMGSHMIVESVKGEGSRFGFHLTLPQQRSADIAASAPVSHAKDHLSYQVRAG